MLDRSENGRYGFQFNIDVFGCGCTPAAFLIGCARSGDRVDDIRETGCNLLCLQRGAAGNEGDFGQAIGVLPCLLACALALNRRDEERLI